jgi:hypothetical protein
MIRKFIWVLMIFGFLIGFVLISDSSARPRPGATTWTVEIPRVLPGSEVSYENVDTTIEDAGNTINQNDFQISIRSNRDGGRIIRWSNLLHSKLKGMFKR